MPYIPRSKRGEQKEELDQPGMLSRTLNLINRPSRAIAGAVRGAFDSDPNTSGMDLAWENLKGNRQDDWDQTLGATGLMEEGPKRAAAGLALDMLVDPLNLVAIGPAARAVGKATGLTKVAQAARKAPVIKPTLDFGRDAVRTLVSPTFGMEEKLANLGRLTNAQQRSAPERVIAELAEGKVKPMTRVKDLDMSIKESFAEDPTKLKAYQDKLAAHDLTLDTFKDPDKSKFSQMLATDQKKVEDTLKSIVGARRQSEREARILDFFTAPENKKYLHTTKDFKPGDRNIRELENISDAGMRKILGQNEDLFVPSDLIETLKVHRVNPTKESGLGKAVDKYMDFWRSGATKYNPRFHITNAIGNVYNMAASGVNPLEAYRQGSKSAMAELGNRNIGGIAGEQIADAIKRFDVDKGLGQHLTYNPGDAAESLRSIEEYSKPKNVISRGADWMGDLIERTARRGTVVADIEKNTKKGMFGGLSELEKRTNKYIAEGLGQKDALRAAQKDIIDNAIIKSKDALFDYRELTPFQSWTRRWAAPFATFGFKNTGLQGKSLLENTKVPAAVGKVLHTIQREADERGAVPQDYVPDWLKDAMSPQIPQPVVDWTAENVPGMSGLKDRPVFAKNVLPITDVNNFGIGTDKDANRNLLNYLGPLPTMALEAVTGKYKGTDRKTMDERGLMTPTLANPIAQLVNAGVEKATGYDMAKNAGDGWKFKNKSDPKLEEVYVPYGANLLMNQVPLLGSVGKATQALVDPEMARDPLAFLSWMGIPVTAQNRKMLEATFKARNLEAKKQRGIEKSEKKRRVR